MCPAPPEESRNEGVALKKAPLLASTEEVKEERRASIKVATMRANFFILVFPPGEGYIERGGEKKQSKVCHRDKSHHRLEPKWPQRAKWQRPDGRDMR